MVSQIACTCSAVILAGGRSTRMHGHNKALLQVGGQTLLNRLITVFEPLVSEILIITRQPELYSEFSPNLRSDLESDLPVRLVEDIYTIRSSLTGVHAGLKSMQTDYAFVVPCDAPLLSSALVRLLIGQIQPELDAIVPVVQGYYEPLCAVYSKRCLAPIEDQFNRQDYKIKHFFNAVQLKAVPEALIKTADPQLHSFMNVNTPEDFEALKKMIR